MIHCLSPDTTWRYYSQATRHAGPTPHSSALLHSRLGPLIIESHSLIAVFLLWSHLWHSGDTLGSHGMQQDWHGLGGQVGGGSNESVGLRAVLGDADGRNYKEPRDPNLAKKQCRGVPNLWPLCASLCSATQESSPKLAKARRQLLILILDRQ
jgi:hypothetical protein